MNRQFITDCENQELNQFRTDYHANYRPAKTTVNFERLYITLFENKKKSEISRIYRKPQIERVSWLPLPRSKPS